MKYIIQISTKFCKDYARLVRRGYDIDKLKTLMSLLVKGEPLSALYKDHPLRDNWKGYRDAHVSPDWLLIYCYVDDDTIRFERTGTHSDLFG
jgi:mRNA interferase YafQ